MAGDSIKTENVVLQENDIVRNIDGLFIGRLDRDNAPSWRLKQKGIQMSNTKTHAERELEILAATTPDALILEFKNEIISLCEAFGKSGQSGGSAPYVAQAISMAVKKLMMQQTIAPLTGEESEWNDVSAINGSPMFQNNRDSRVFKDGNGIVTFVEAIIWDGDKGNSFTGWVGDISSSQKIKGFPFEPKTFRVDVIDFRWKDKEETIPDENGDWWTHKIKDENQLKEVFEYYDKSAIPGAAGNSSATPAQQTLCDGRSTEQPCKLPSATSQS